MQNLFFSIMFSKIILIINSLLLIAIISLKSIQSEYCEDDHVFARAVNLSNSRTKWPNNRVVYELERGAFTKNQKREINWVMPKMIL